MSKSAKCSVCSEKCHSGPTRRPSIYCGTCKCWVHWNCNGISDVEGKFWGQIEVEYVCVSCRTCDDGSYDFLMASQRLSKASHYGLKKFTAAAEAENMFLRNVPLEIPPKIKTFQFHMQDQVANTLLARFHCSQLAALESTGDGNCLYNAISLLLTGNENMSTELRYRSAIELATNKRKITQNPMFSRFSIEDEINTEILKSPRNGAYSSMINFLAVSSMLQMPINVVYPAVNSARTYLFKSTNCTIRFPFADPTRTLNIMWSSTSLPSSRPTAANPWESNHIVPLVDLPRGPILDMGPAFAVWQSQRKKKQTKLETYNRFSVLEDEDNETVRTATKTAPAKSVAKTTAAEQFAEPGEPSSTGKSVRAGMKTKKRPPTKSATKTTFAEQVLAFGEPSSFGSESVPAGMKTRKTPPTKSATKTTSAEQFSASDERGSLGSESVRAGMKTRKTPPTDSATKTTSAEQVWSSGEPSSLGSESDRATIKIKKTQPTKSPTKTSSAEHFAVSGEPSSFDCESVPAAKSNKDISDLNTGCCEIESESSVLSFSEQFEEHGSTSPVGNHFVQATMHHATSFSDMENNIADDTNKSSTFSPTEISTPLSRSIVTNTSEPTCISESESYENNDTSECNVSSWTLPRAQNIIDLPFGKSLAAEELYKIVIDKSKLCESVPCGDKSNSYVVVDNSRNINQMTYKKRCDFYDDCGIWESQKGNTVKTKFAVTNTNTNLTHVELKKNVFCKKHIQQGRTIWLPLEPQPTQIVTLSRYYATSRANPNFKKRVSYFTSDFDNNLGNVAVYEYIGEQPATTAPHGRSNTSRSYVRTNPVTLDNIKEKIKDQSKRPREIFHELKADDSTNCVRDFEAIRRIKCNEKKKEKKQMKQKHNIADEILDVIGMLNTHPFVRTIIHHKEHLPSILCYTEEQILDLKHFLANNHEDPLGIDRTFNLGPFYATIIVYKNQRLVRKNGNVEHPIFMGPLMLHKDATYKTYKGFLEHVATELDSKIDHLELRVSENMVFGSDDERALTNAIEHVFPGAKRLLCTKHLKDNVKFHLQNKVGIANQQREQIMSAIFDTKNGIIGSNTSFEFEERSTSLITETEHEYPAFKTYFEKHLKTKLKNNVFQPQRNSKQKTWTNNNAESINNIVKLTTNWQPKETPEIVEKLYSITKLHFMDYRSALHDSGNYRLNETERRRYIVPEPLWRCKTEDEKVTLFRSFLRDDKRKISVKFLTSRDKKYSVVNRGAGTARKPGQRKRSINERARSIAKRQRVT